MDPQLPQETSYTYATISSAPPKKRAGRIKFRETRHPVFKGVRRRGNGERWVCEVREPNKKSRIWLGTFPTAEMAARAHDVAAMALRGRKACLNFADSAWRLSVPSSSSHKDIQTAASVAAEMFRPSSLESDIADQKQSRSSSELMSSSSSAKSSLLVPNTVDAIEFGRDYYWDTLMEQFTNSSSYCLDDSECVADVSLWSYSDSFFV